MKNCWEIYNCGREKANETTTEQEVCVIAKWQLGHSCWVSADFSPKNKTELPMYSKRMMCDICEVYKLYNRSDGPLSMKICEKFPNEEKKYQEIMICRELELN